MPTLKEFDLDIPYKSNQGSRDDYEMNWKDKRLKFSNEVRCICSLYEQNFEKIRTDECWKVLVECVETVTDYRVRCYGGVCHICIPLDIKRYFSLVNLEKKKIILSVLKQGIDRVVEEKKWDKAPFEHAYQNVISNAILISGLGKSRRNALIENIPQKYSALMKLMSLAFGLLLRTVMEWKSIARKLLEKYLMSGTLLNTLAN